MTLAETTILSPNSSFKVRRDEDGSPLPLKPIPTELVSPLNKRDPAETSSPSSSRSIPLSGTPTSRSTQSGPPSSRKNSTGTTMASPRQGQEMGLAFWPSRRHSAGSRCTSEDFPCTPRSVGTPRSMEGGYTPRS
eukprot:CAMPEP_0174337618 /NCGR_PEP_ID=MMETSP0810-20121108/22480_1 /TAXON_ID=73025 ORGANISM="Eutreptiella gymnastica-like, Strain CCMP1594" /NCGR_SAMPLE_ID=MMETSP0810 /ASSEMBLY_ACC=CAM_ASM_000659 /LENGTH=134 /DNA_ID=CAMNT_0015457211 /DNA_START=34 /DNA_END=435 /DNA_ORIENTATION=+